MRFSNFKSWLAGLCVLALVGCGGGGGGSGGDPILPGDGSGSNGGGTTAPTLTLDVTLVDSTGEGTTDVVAGQPVRAQAVLKRSGVALVGQIVQFSVDQSVSLVKLDPESGSQLTGAGGLAALTVSSLGAATGAGRVVATTTVGTQTVTGSANFFASGSVGTQPTTLTLESPVVLSPSVSAYGSTGITVQVRQNGQPYTQPVTVSFTNSCAAGKATLTPSAITQPTGIAVATFVDNGCAQTADGDVTITASIGSDTKSATVRVIAPTAGSLRFVSVTPSDKSITLRGQGGNGRQENASLVFRLVDLAGNGVADADVCFDSTTYVGNLNLDGFLPIGGVPANPPACGTADVLSKVNYIKRTNADGTVIVQINSGSVPTPVRVRARTFYAGKVLETYSDTLSISTGLPLQRSFSLSVDKANIDGGNFDGEIAIVTARLADQFSNPVPDGTVVNFVGSGASVCTANNGSCSTVNGACFCNVVSQERRPQDHRVVVTAYAVGLEDFDDNNGNNVYDLAADRFTDLGNVFVDANKDGIAGAPTRPMNCVPNLPDDGSPNATVNGDTDILIPFQSTAFQRCGDGVRNTAHIRASTVIYLSNASTGGDPTAILPLTQFSREQNFLGTGIPSANFIRLQPSCPEGTPVPQATIALLLEDGWGNPMAAGTRVAAVDSSDNVNANTVRPGQVLAFGARPPSPLIDLPNVAKPLTWTQLPDGVAKANGTVFSNHSILVRGVQDKCAGNGAFALEVTSPRGGAAAVRLLYDGEARDVSRGGFAVRYRPDGASLAVSLSNNRADLTTAAFVGQVDSQAVVVSGTIDWNDGRPAQAFGTAANGVISIPVAFRSATYASNGLKTVRLSLLLTDGSTVSATANITVSGL
ncbi:MAG: hypothetical protein V4795_20795 [Pseudomonadota bacterium]